MTRYRCPKCEVVADRECAGENCTCECGHQQNVYTGKSAGLGDTVAKGLSAVGIKKKRGCGCSKRQKWLNRMFPYKR